MYIPKEIRTIILNYVESFHKVEEDIDDCLNSYFALEHRGARILEQFCDRTHCPLHRFEIKLRVEQVVKEASRLIELILSQQTCLPILNNMISFLMTELTVDSFNLYLMPLVPLHDLPATLYASDEETSEYDHTNDEITDMF
jgi:hypothetical protein